MRRRHGLAAGLTMVALLCAARGMTVPAQCCPMIGATYTARSANPSPDLSYRLKIEELPRSAPAAAVATLWRFQTIRRATGKPVSELRMHFSCPNGNGACSVSPPSRPGLGGGVYSEVVQLARDFTPTTYNDTPYAIVLPGFATADWMWTSEGTASPDLTLAPGVFEGPDLSGQQVWLLTGCGNRGPRPSNSRRPARSATADRLTGSARRVAFS